MNGREYDIVYKYLDVQGGLKMLQNSNLQFTNATKFNDPFDCHPALFDYSNTPTNKNNWPPADFLKLKAETDMKNIRNSTWICSLSKVYDSLLMWAYYNSHKGICIGLNLDSLLDSCQRNYVGLVFPYPAEVKYRDILQKPDYFKDTPSWNDLLITKAKDWEHEQEIRLITKEPMWIRAGQNVPQELKDEKLIDGKEIRHYPIISGDCFESIYLGVNIFHRDKDEIIKAAKKLNPKIKIYQMTIDPEAFKLKEQLIEE